MALGFSTTLRNSRLDQVGVLADSGAGAATIQIYDGTRPTDADTAVTTQVLLAELTMSDPAFPAAAGGSVSASAITSDASADATGTATWFRMVASNGTIVMDGDVGTSGSDLNLTTTSITLGGTVSISTFTLTGGNA